MFSRFSPLTHKMYQQHILQCACIIFCSRKSTRLSVPNLIQIKEGKMKKAGQIHPSQTYNFNVGITNIRYIEYMAIIPTTKTKLTYCVERQFDGKIDWYYWSSASTHPQRHRRRRILYTPHDSDNNGGDDNNTFCEY